jgi:hypothetical protein
LIDSIKATFLCRFQPLIIFSARMAFITYEYRL